MSKCSQLSDANKERAALNERHLGDIKRSEEKLRESSNKIIQLQTQISSLQEQLVCKRHPNVWLLRLGLQEVTEKLRVTNSDLSNQSTNLAREVRQAGNALYLH